MERPTFFVFIFGDKCLVVTECFLWKIIFWQIEMYFWMYMWGYIFIVESLIFLCFFIFVGWQISNELTIGGIFQFVMSRLKEKHHLNVDVWKWGFVFVKCTICESMKDLISKLGKNSNEVLKYVVKLKKHILHQKSCRNL